MIPYKDLQVGDWVYVEVENERLEGQVEELAEGQVCVRTYEDNLYWYEPEEVDPIPLTEEQLFSFGFEKQENPEIAGPHGIAYVKGPFIIRYPDKQNRAHCLLICHGEHTREIEHALSVHELQHHYHAMTKILLEKPESSEGKIEKTA
ncbi:MAG: hypothetical protein IRZ01_07480 [Thermoflavifilum aggregans]|nr:hypothetical protein [Thermoflavifilum aggregans]